jgi:hypothetical protein
MKLVSLLLAPAGVLLFAGAASAQDHADYARRPHFVQPDLPQVATLYADGSQIVTEWERIWRGACSQDPFALGESDLRDMAALHDWLMLNGPVTTVDTPRTAGAGINFVFNVSGGIPSGALTAIANAEVYMESLFADPITVTIDLSFANLGPGVLGGTSSFYTSSTWSNSRTGLVNGMDAGDTIQSSLPTGSTIPVRYGSSSSVTNEGTVFWTRADFNSTVGSVAGSAASMQFNNTFTFDYDPANGITGGYYSFIDVMVHECGHALGFTSGADFRFRDIEALDVYRFQRTDGTGDYNPDTTAEFQVRARLVAKNKPNDDHNSDLISVEYRMSDGSPYQASHFREQSGASWIGLMDPALAAGETHYPAYFQASDLTMFDAIGYDR